MSIYVTLMSGVPNKIIELYMIMQTGYSTVQVSIYG